MYLHLFLSSGLPDTQRGIASIFGCSCLVSIPLQSAGACQHDQVSRAWCKPKALLAVSHKVPGSRRVQQAQRGAASRRAMETLLKAHAMARTTPRLSPLPSSIQWWGSALPLPGGGGAFTTRQ
jgi:hypothetical protein